MATTVFKLLFICTGIKLLLIKIPKFQLNPFERQEKTSFGFSNYNDSTFADHLLCHLLDRFVCQCALNSPNHQNEQSCFHLISSSARADCCGAVLRIVLAQFCEWWRSSVFHRVCQLVHLHDALPLLAMHCCKAV